MNRKNISSSQLTGQLTVQLAELMTVKGLSQIQIASQIGKSPAVVSQYLKGVYKGDTG